MFFAWEHSWYLKISLYISWILLEFIQSYSIKFSSKIMV